MGALSLFLLNLICVNLADMTTFLVQGIRPATWWEKNRAVKATRITIGLWVSLLAILAGLILSLREGCIARARNPWIPFPCKHRLEETSKSGEGPGCR